MAEFVALFAFGTIWFWTLIAIASFVLMATIEHEKGWLATFTIIGTLLLVHYGMDKQLFGSMFAHPLITGSCVLGYFLVGAAWGVVKWWFFVKSQREAYDEARKLFAEHRSKPKVQPPERDWNYYTSAGGYCGIYFNYKPKPKDFKSRIMMWMTYWPWSMVWTVINDPIRKAFRAIFTYVSSTLNRISESGFSDTENDFPVSKKGKLDE